MGTLFRICTHGMVKYPRYDLVPRTFQGVGNLSTLCKNNLYGTNSKVLSFSSLQKLTRSVHSVKQIRAFSTRTRTRIFTNGRAYLQPLGISCRRVFQTSAINSAKEASTNATRKVPQFSEITKLLGLAKPEKWKLLGAVCLLVISSAITMAVPYGLGRVIDIIYNQSQDSKDMMVSNLTKLCKILFFVFLLGGIANFGRVYLMQTSGNRIIKRLREQVFSSIIRQEMAFFDKNKTGELINRLSTDTSIVGTSVTNNISDGLRSTVQAIGGVSMMVYMCPKLAGIALCIVPPVILMSRIYGKYVQKITKNVQDSLAESTQIAEERLSNMRTVRAFAQETREEQVYTQQVENVLQLTYKEALARAVFWGSMGMSGNMMMLAIIYSGGMMMHHSTITVGALTSFLMYAGFVGVSVGGLTGFYSELMRGLGASTRLFQLEARKPLISLTDGFIPQTPIRGDIEFRGVGFSYPSRTDMPILQDFNLTVPWGQILAVVGPSGSGKSTLAAMLFRFYDPDEGGVYVDDTNIKTFNSHWLRTHMGIVSQEPVLFSNSIAENIAYGARDPAEVTPQQIIEAAKMANAYGFIQSFPKGMDTLVGERGVMLSGGQKQRIAIARAIIKDPKILILDEATSALDAESEYLVQEALERVMFNRTVITIAHRLSTIKNAHQIAVLDHGKVVEKGSYFDLMNIHDGTFRKLVERQTIVNS